MKFRSVSWFVAAILLMAVLAGCAAPAAQPGQAAADQPCARCLGAGEVRDGRLDRQEADRFQAESGDGHECAEQLLAMLGPVVGVCDTATWNRLRQRPAGAQRGG